MGLDIVAFRRLTPAHEAAVDDDGCPIDHDRYCRIFQSSIDFADKYWPGRTEGVSAGIYLHQARYDFRAGSYGGYGEWRRALARFAGFESAESVWAAHPTGPFVELIDFADNEGVIGPIVAAKLAKDFADGQDRADQSPDAWFRDRYAKWRTAFEMAADCGAVDFR